MPLPQETIRRKRDGRELAEAEIAEFVAGLSAGTIGEGQAGAFAMAVFLRGLTRRETVALTRAMTRSGEVLTWPDLPGPVLDKHSTGGVGDKVSLVLAPLVAACGGFVPMISGRGLGHTGGTLDKLGAIPGYQTQPNTDRFRAVVGEAGCAIIGQTARLAPADGRLYAIRDVTATVESIPLITASILAKKLAAGLDGLAMDVKIGSGAFMTQADAARDLAHSLVEVATGAELPTTALITDMNEVLGTTAGNALEIGEAIDYLTGASREARLDAVTMALGAEMLLLGRLAGDPAEARARLSAALASGAAAERFARMVAALGGPVDLLEHPERHLARAPVVQPALPAAPGFVQRIDVRRLGLAIVALGGGRARIEDVVDPGVGLAAVAGLGAPVGPGDPLAVVHARSQDSAATAASEIAGAFIVGPTPPPPAAALLGRIEAAAQAAGSPK